MLIGDLFRRNAQVVPDRVAASLGEEELTHAALHSAANRLAGVLRAEGRFQWPARVLCIKYPRRLICSSLELRPVS